MTYFVWWDYHGKSSAQVVDDKAEAEKQVAWATSRGLENAFLEDVQPTLDHFRLLVEKHDLTYDFSDDHSVWRRGQHERARIKQLMKAIGDDAACTRIWNETCRQKIQVPYCEQFTWKGFVI